jgi:hypothetical protein
VKRVHKHVAEVVDSLSEFNVSGPECRRVSSALTTIAAMDATVLEKVVEHLSDDEASVVNSLLATRRNLTRQWK